jgi:hypothetical protein
MECQTNAPSFREPWNKGKLVGQKAPLKLKEIWAIRVRLQLADRRRELALYNLAIDSKLWACDLVKLRVRDVCHGQAVASRTIVLQQKTQRPARPGSVRDYGADAGGRGGVDPASGPDFREFLVSEPTSPLSPSVDEAVRPDCGFLGQAAGIGHGKLWNPHAQADESHADLSSHEEAPGRAATARAHEAGKYRALPGH